MSRPAGWKQHLLRGPRPSFTACRLPPPPVSAPWPAGVCPGTQAEGLASTTRGSCPHCPTVWPRVSAQRMIAGGQGPGRPKAAPCGHRAGPLHTGAQNGEKPRRGPQPRRLRCHVILCPPDAIFQAPRGEAETRVCACDAAAAGLGWRSGTVRFLHGDIPNHPVSLPSARAHHRGQSTPLRVCWSPSLTTCGRAAGPARRRHAQAVQQASPRGPRWDTEAHESGGFLQRQNQTRDPRGLRPGHGPHQSPRMRLWPGALPSSALIVTAPGADAS